MIVEEVPSALEGERLDRVVALLADVSRSVAAELIVEGAVQIDGVEARSGKVRLDAGATVAIDTTKIRVARPARGR